MVLSYALVVYDFSFLVWCNDFDIFNKKRLFFTIVALCYSVNRTVKDSELKEACVVQRKWKLYFNRTPPDYPLNTVSVRE